MAIKANTSTNLEIQETKSLAAKDAKRQSFLITFYTPREGDSFVLLQASHSTRPLQFPNLESTFEFLEHQIRKDKKLENP